MTQLSFDLEPEPVYTDCWPDDSALLFVPDGQSIKAALVAAGCCKDDAWEGQGEG